MNLLFWVGLYLLVGVVFVPLLLWRAEMSPIEEMRQGGLGVTLAMIGMVVLWPLVLLAVTA